MAKHLFVTAVAMTTLHLAFVPIVDSASRPTCHLANCGQCKWTHCKKCEHPSYASTPSDPTCTSVQDVNAFGQVYDLSCCHVFKAAAYHRLADCLWPSLPALHNLHLSVQQGLRPVALIPHHLQEYYVPLIPATTAVLKTTGKLGDCFLIDGGIDNKRIMNSWNATLDPWPWIQNATSSQHMQMLRDLMLKNANITVPDHASSNTDLTIIQRHGKTRNFLNMQDILQAFQSEFPDLRIRVYHGNETALETMKMFAGSRVVVGYHGAGLANALFCPKGTVVLEYTTFKNVTGKSFWRSNEAIATKNNDIKWILHYVDTDRLSDDANATNFGRVEGTLRHHPDPDHYVKDLSVKLSRGVIYNSITRIKTNMELMMSSNTSNVHLNSKPNPNH